MRRQFGGNFADCADGGYAAIGFAQLLEPLMGRSRLEDRSNSRFHFGLRLFKLPRDQFGPTELSAKLRPEFRLQRAHRQPTAISRLVQVVAGIAAPQYLLAR